MVEFSGPASQFYQAALRAQRAGTGGPGDPEASGADGGAPAGPSFADTVADVAQSGVDALMRGEQASQDMMAGRADAQTVVEALAQAELALETAVAVRDKVVQAYQEILRMPI